MHVAYQRLPVDPTPTDAPPSYGAIQTDQDHPQKPVINEPIQTLSPSPALPDKTSAPVKIARKDKLAGNTRDISNNWFNLNTGSSSRTSREIRNIVLGLLCDLQGSTSLTSTTAINIFGSCAGACATHGIPFSDILQKPNIEGHTALYWAIVKAYRREVVMNQGPDFVTSLISYALPLKEQTVIELRQACLAISDQNLFNKLRQCPGVAQMSTVDQMLLGIKIPPDEIEVVELEGSKFAVNFVVPQFHTRMAVSKSIRLEFIARGMHYFW